MIGRIACSVTAPVLPFDQLTRIGGWLIATMIVLPLLRYRGAGFAYRRQRRWARREGIG